MFQENDQVRYQIDNSCGTITGRKREIVGHDVLYQVRFNNAECKYLPESKLEIVEEVQDIQDLFGAGTFYGITEFRRTIYKNRLSGDLTNILYSMDNTCTKFLAHQFIPVIKFLESYTQRLLIADEVGLGKTIESMYIWKELVARNGAKRLLIVVPAVLRYKWQKDLDEFFNIEAQIVNAKELKRNIEIAIERPISKSFALITSLEGLRISQEVSELLETNTTLQSIFDMVIMDEAHYLRNSETKSFKIAEKLRDASDNFLLLSATPIQTGSNNLYNLLNLLAPEDFYNNSIFDYQLSSNRPLVKFTNALDRNNSKEEIEQTLDELIDTKDDEFFVNIKENLDSILETPLLRIQTIEKLKDRYFYNNYLTRTRKRDVIKDRVQRCIGTIKFELTAPEKYFYDTVTQYLKNNSSDYDQLSIFRLIARQRQMASCLPAALGAWRNINEKIESGEDSLYEEEDTEKSPKFKMPSFEEIDLDELKELDSKYNSFLSEIKKLISNNPHEKIIVFSFFRDTIHYLFERMIEDGISAEFIMGGITLEEKAARIEAFKKQDINVLISSEVGSEGIDLQFAKYEINYDLPWNPMRIEQRIGRIDRIGQESDKIYIFNAVCQNTIEDKILDRLYARIKVFQESLGDLEDILGEELQKLAIDIFNSGELTDEEIEQKAIQVENYLAHSENNNNRLEEAAGNLSMYQNYVLNNINIAQQNKRYIAPTELITIITDFLNTYFPGSTVTTINNGEYANIRLSEEARYEFADFVQHKNLTTSLAHSVKPVCCRFITNLEHGKKTGYFEDVDITHPLVKWITSLIKTDPKFGIGCSSIYLSNKYLNKKLKDGIYTFMTSQIKVNGVKRINELHYILCNSEDTSNIITSTDAENIIMTALQHGESYDTSLLNDEVLDNAIDSINYCIDTADQEYSNIICDIDEKNKAAIKEQKEYLEKTCANKLNKIETTISNIRNSSDYDDQKKKKIIPMHQGRYDKILREKEEKLKQIEDKLVCSPEISEIALGLLVIGK